MKQSAIMKTLKKMWNMFNDVVLFNWIINTSLFRYILFISLDIDLQGIAADCKAIVCGFCSVFVF